MSDTFKKQIETLVDEIEQLTFDNIADWMEENIIDIRNSQNELIYVSNSQYSHIYIDSGIIKSQKGYSPGEGFSSYTVYLDCNTTIFKYYFYVFKEWGSR